MAKFGAMIGGADVTIRIRPDVTKPGSFLVVRLPPRPSGPSSFLCVFNNERDRDAWLDMADEQIFDLNHPVRK